METGKKGDAELIIADDTKGFFTVRDRRTGEAIDTKHDPMFRDFELMVTPGGMIAMLQYGTVICFADGKRYEACPAEGGGSDGAS